MDYIITSYGLMPERYLAHYGVPGMKWGVRRYQPYYKGNQGSLIGKIRNRAGLKAAASKEKKQAQNYDYMSNYHYKEGSERSKYKRSKQYDKNRRRYGVAAANQLEYIRDNYDNYQLKKSTRKLKKLRRLKRAAILAGTTMAVVNEAKGMNDPKRKTAINFVRNTTNKVKAPFVKRKAVKAARRAAKNIKPVTSYLPMKI